MTLSNKDFIMTSECDRNVNQFPLKIFTRWGWLLGIFSTFWVNTANGQITPDSTLPNNSDVKVEENTSIIEGGTTAGSNLFHSFKEFSLSTGNEAHFNNAVDINNIITRVTGGSVSRIDGLIKAEGSANLFLINPNGIVFGENAKLDIGGSFIGATADSIKFADDIEFSAKNPQNTPLLTVSVPLGLQYDANPGKIEINGKGEPPREPPEVYEPQFGLQVLSNKTLALLGGDVLLNGATLKADSGRIELGSVVGEGLVNIEPLKEGFDFNFDNIENFGEIQLSQNTAVDTSGNGAGSIKLTSKNLSLADNSVISSTQTGTEKSAGIVINAKELVNLNGENDTFIPSGLYANNVSGDVTENTGNININTQQLTVQNGAIVTTNAWGAGNSGDIEIQTNNLKVESGAKISINTHKSGNTGDLKIDAENIEVVGKLSVSAKENSTGNAGDLNINTTNLGIERDAVVSASTYNSGDGGDLKIDAENIEVIGELSVSAKENSTGNTGDLNINTANLFLKDGGFIFAGTSGEGNGGDLNIVAEDIKAIGDGSNLLVEGEPSSTGDSGSLIINTNKMLVESAFVSASNDGQGSAGELKITTNELLLKNNARFFTGRVTEEKDVGNLTIKTNNLRIKGGSSIQAGVSGNRGNLNIDADEEVEIIGTGNNGNTPSSMTVLTKKKSIADSGNLTINTKRIRITDGAFISTGTSENNDGGDITINATELVEFIGKGGNNPDKNDLPYLSGVFSKAEKTSTGNAGKVIINTKEMVVKDGATINISTDAQTNEEDLTINTNPIVIEAQEKIDSSTFDEKIKSEIVINADKLQLKDSIVNAQSTGIGEAGNIIINLKDNLNVDNGEVVTKAEQSSGGDINITAGQNIFLRNNSDIKTTLTTTAGSGGNITLNANAIVALEDSDILAFAPEGVGGDITFNTRAFFSNPLYRPTPQTAESTTKEELEKLDGNNRVDVDATGRVSTGNIIGIPDINFLENSLTELAQNPIDSEALVASSCVVRSKERSGTFFITGKSNFSHRPNDTVPSDYSAVEVQPLPNNTSSKPRRRWKIGDPIVEPSGVYRLENGRRVLSRECGR